MKATARTLAFDALTAVRRRGAYLTRYNDAAFRRAGIKADDRRLATAISKGVLRHRRWLDWHLARLSKIPPDKMEPAVLDALRMGFYQLAHMDRIPDRVAVDETVKLVPKRAKGFVNGLLRRLAREAEERPEPRGSDDIETLGIRTSHPDWMVRMWVEAYGHPRAEDILLAGLTEPPAVLRPCGMEPDALIHALRDEGIEAAATRWSRRGVRVKTLDKALASRIFLRGGFVVQGEASQLVAELLGAGPGESVLDLCAAPGGKTTDLAETVGTKGRVVALDRHAKRLSLVNDAARRLGLDNISTIFGDASRPFDLEASPFDRVLVDAPCTGLGQLAKNPEAKWRLGPEDPRRLAEEQLKILSNAAPHLKPGGRLVYAVCTISPEENRGVVDRFLAERRDFVSLDVRELMPEYLSSMTHNRDYLFWPSPREPEGFYACVFRKTKG